MSGQHVKITSRPFPLTYTVGATPDDSFDFEGPFWAAEDIIVTVDGVELGQDEFTVAGNFLQNGELVVGAYGGGTVTLNVAVSNKEVVIDRLVVDTRETDYGTGPFSQNTLNSDLDKLTARDQDIIARLPVTSGTSLNAGDVRDIVADFLIAGTNVTLTRVGTELTVAATAGGGSVAWGDLTGMPAAIDAIDGLTPAADRIAYYTGASAAALAPLTSFGRSLIDDSDAAAARTTLGVAIGSQVQAYHANLAALALLEPLADKLTYWTSGAAAALTDFTSVARTLVAQTTQAAMRTTGLGLGDLATLNTITASLISDPTNVKTTESLVIAASDETTALTVGTGKVTFRMPYAFTLTAVRASLTTVSSSGVVTVDINEGGVSILSTLLTIDANEKTSTTAATPAVISDTALADDAEITVDIDGAGTGAKGLKVVLIGRRT